MTVLILHGVQGHAGVHWQQWLHDELIKKGHTVIMPSLPNAARPGRSEWLEAIKKSIENIDLSQLIIVGHSLGVPAALDFIEQANTKIKSLVSVAGFSDNYGSEYNDFYMKVKIIDFEKVNKNLEKRIVIYSDADPYVPQKSLQLLSSDLNTEPIIISKGGHFNTEAGYTEFPLLLKIIEKINNS